MSSNNFSHFFFKPIQHVWGWTCGYEHKEAVTMVTYLDAGAGGSAEHGAQDQCGVHDGKLKTLLLWRTKKNQDTIGENVHFTTEI